MLNLTIVEFIGHFSVIISATIGVSLMDGLEEQVVFFDKTYEIILEAIPLEKIFILSGGISLVSLVPLVFIKYKKRNNKNTPGKMFGD